MAITRDIVTNEFAIRHFVHIFEPVGRFLQVIASLFYFVFQGAQDTEMVIAVIQDVLQRIKSERPEIERAYFRSDNARM